MRIEKKGNAITCLADWEKFAGPKTKDQWVDGRSAYELAYAWCGSGAVAMPLELRALLDSHKETQGMAVESVNPEQRIVFDRLGGEPRNADLAFTGHTASAKIAVTVEAKADEPFSATVGETLAAALERLIENPKSKGVRRVEGMVRTLFSPRVRGQRMVSDLRYQLLTATAGTLAYASQQEASVAVLVVHEFVTPKTQDERHAENASDYRAFLTRLSGWPASAIERTGFLGPFSVPGVPLFETIPPLLIGKIISRRRSAGG